MFQPGDLVIYGSTGVCRVEAVEQPGLSGGDGEKMYYRLKPLHQDGLIYTPAEGGKVAMRAVISRAEAEALVELIPTIHAQPWQGGTLQALAQRYQAVVRTHDCRELLELILSIYAKRRQAESQKRRLGMVDEQYRKQAERLLHGELAVALDIPFEDMEAHLAAQFRLEEEPAEEATAEEPIAETPKAGTEE